MTNITAEINSFLDGVIRSSASNKGIALVEVDDKLDLFESGILDSMGFVSIVSAIESKFSVELDFSELEPEEFTTFGGLSRVVRESLAKA